MRRIATWAVLRGAGMSATLLVFGCAQYQPGRGFDEVQNTVSERTGMRVHWNANSPEDVQAASAVSDMLSRELGADEAVQIALLNNKRLQATYEDLSISQAELVKAGLLKNPVFHGELRFGFGGGNAVVLDVAQDFISLLYLPLRKSRAEAEFEIAKVRVTGAVLDMAANVRRAYYEHVAAVQELELMRNVDQATEASADLAERLRAAGNIRALDVASERALHEESLLGANRAAARAVRTRERLNALMGLLGAQTAWRAAERLPEVPAAFEADADLEEKAMRASLELDLARKQVIVALKTLGITRPFPWLHEGEIGAAGEKEVEGEWSLGPSLTIPIPIFDNGEADTQAAKAELRRVYAKQAALASEIHASTRAAAEELRAAHTRAVQYRATILPLREQITEESQLQYNAMQISAFQLLLAKRDQIGAGIEYVGSVREYWVARCKLDRILRGGAADFAEMDSNTDSDRRGSISEAERGH